MLLFTFETIDLIVTDMIVGISNFLKTSTAKIDFPTIKKQPNVLNDVEMIIVIQNNFILIFGMINFLHFISFRVNETIILFLQIIIMKSFHAIFPDSANF